MDVPVMLVIETWMTVGEDDPDAEVEKVREMWQRDPGAVGEHLSAHGVAWLNVKRYPVLR